MRITASACGGGGDCIKVTAPTFKSIDIFENLCREGTTYSSPSLI